MTERTRTGLAVAAFALLLAIVYADPLFTRRNFVGRDLAAYNLPMEKMIHDAYGRGRLPVWSAEISGGRPLLPNPNAGALYPVRMLLAALSFPLAMRLYPVLHWIAAAAGSILLLRSIGTSAAAAWIGAATYVFSGVAVSEIYFPHHLPGLALLPWIVWAIHKPFGSASRRIVWLAVLFAVDLYAAEVFTILLGIGAAALWILLETEPAGRRTRLRELLAALTLAALAAAPQIVASALWVEQTGRAVTGMTVGQVTLYSLSPLRLLELVVPYPFGATWKLEPWAVWGSVFRGRPLGLFSTLYSGALGVLAVVTVARSSRPGVGARFGKALLALGIGLSVLPGLVPESWASLRAPLALRNPEKFAVAIAFALSLLSARAFDLYRRAQRPPRRALAAGILLAALAVGCALAPAASGRLAASLLGDRSQGSPQSAAAVELPVALAEAAILWILTVVAVDVLRRPGRGATAAALLLLTFVPIAATRRIPELAGEQGAFAPTAFARMQQKKDPVGAFRALGESIYRPLPAGLTEPGLGWLPSPARTWTEHTQALWGRGTVFNDDSDAGDLVRMETLRRLSGYAAGFRDAGAFFGSFALRWGIRFPSEQPVAGYRRVGGDAAMDWDEHERPYPDVRLAEHWREEAAGVDALRAMPGLSVGQIVIESGGRRDGQARPGSLRILKKTPERLVLETSAPDPTWLFVLREFWEFRRVLLDGRPVPTFPAQIAFSAIAVPAGSHRIEWTELVPGGTVSRWGPVLSLLIATLALAREHFLGRER